MCILLPETYSMQYYMKVAGATQSLFNTDKYYVGPYSQEIQVGKLP